MADEAFALSPISARASLPSEEDYDAISQAFMETSRGRWFLGEYAKRNRNADTRMVLDAVARIEESLAAQKQAASEDRLTEALAAIRRAVDEAQAAASAAVEGLALEESLAPIRKGTTIIREISWRWREIGADSRICDLIDSQVGAIEGACGQIASMSPQADLSAAFDLIKARIAGLGDGDTAAPQAAEEAVQPPAPAASDQMAAAAVEAVPETSAANDAEAAMSLPAEETAKPVMVTAVVVDVTAEAVETTAEAANAAAEAVDMTAEAVDAAPEAAEESPEAAEAYDEALLDMVALEMAAPDLADIDDACELAADEIPAMASPPAEPIIVVETPEPEKPQPMAAPVQRPAIEPSLQLQPSPKPFIEPSLGSTLLANGIVPRPTPAASDPFVPIRRMSQAEKIAFFS